MDRFKRFLKRAFCLPPLPAALIAIPSFALVFWVLAEGLEGGLAYVSYLASAYSLTIVLTGFPGILRAIRQGVQNHPMARRILRIPAGKRFVEDVRFRTVVFLYQGLAVNLLYIAVKLYSGIRYRSPWFVALALYYALLAAMRFSLLYRGKGGALSREGELRRYRICGIMLLMMNFALAGIVMFMVHQNKGYEYPGLLIYGMALYSFYAAILAAVNVARSRKHGSPVLSAAKAINLAAATVSILSLQTAMLAQFGGSDGPAFRKRMTGATGAGVCCVVFGMAIFMIANSTKSLRQARREGMEKEGLI